MNLCSQDHDEVCYDGRHCPACSVAKVKDKEIEKLTDENSSLLDDIHELRQQLDEAKQSE